ncbi:hypothetical protein BD413DRAFT_672353 [Trametes elegans]|nr:hypothetical protein BD413DRAFT_672353 [Trametes elegans]
MHPISQAQAHSATPSARVSLDALAQLDLEIHTEHLLGADAANAHLQGSAQSLPFLLVSSRQVVARITHDHSGIGAPGSDLRAWLAQTREGCAALGRACGELVGTGGVASRAARRGRRTDFDFAYSFDFDYGKDHWQHRGHGPAKFIPLPNLSQLGHNL